MTALSALATLLLFYAYPPLVPFGLVATVNVYLWRRRAEMLRLEREWARAEEWQWTRTDWPR
jgi:hypothetical protein